MPEHWMIQLADDPRWITGIYNYCDRWCERCAFQARCLAFAVSRRDEANGTKGSGAKALVENLQAACDDTFELLKQAAEKFGVDVDGLQEESSRAFVSGESDTPDSWEQERAAVQANPLVSGARAYGGLVRAWFDSEQALFDDKRQELLAKLELGLVGERVESEATRVVDAVEVIRWFQYQIAAKLARAVTPLSPDEEGDDPIQTDANGSAKIALIGIERSIDAWDSLRKMWPGRGDSILAMLAHLDRLRRETDGRFPDARRFVRPGFDTLAESHQGEVVKDEVRRKEE